MHTDKRVNEDETPEFWERFERRTLTETCAALHQQRRVAAEAKGAEEIEIVRRTLADVFIRGNGIEVGAGSRPFPIPAHASCFYGDVRNHTELAKYFSTELVTVSGRIDAQTLDGIQPESLDFIISAHVIEHLYDPMRAIKEAIRRLRMGGVLLIAVPEMTRTWDRRRPVTTLRHVLDDERDGGESTRLQAYIEHATYVHPEMTGEDLPPADIERMANATMAKGMDLHVHAWTEEEFFQVIQHVAVVERCQIAARLSAVNENIYVLRRVGEPSLMKSGFVKL
jgi:SAM-dependent methyltransferase